LGRAPDTKLTLFFSSELGLFNLSVASRYMRARGNMG
jgi:hypothetical protein